jgi:hypothetical protein
MATEDDLEQWAGETFSITLDPASFANIKNYWVRGEGAAKIRWGTDGSFDRCVRKLRKHFPQDPKGLCANMHKEATGEWPAEKPIPS